MTAAIEDLIGLRVIESAYEAWVSGGPDRERLIGGRHRTKEKTRVLFVQSEGQLHALFDGNPVTPALGRSAQVPARIGISRLGDGEWPFLNGWQGPSLAPAPPIVCNLFWRPDSGIRRDVGRLAGDSDRVLVAVDDARNLVVLEVGIERYEYQERREREATLMIPLSSGSAIPPGVSHSVTVRPNLSAFRPLRIVIGGRPESWIVNDIIIGRRSQFAQSVDIPGEMFAAMTIDSFVTFEMVQMSMDFEMRITYVGSDPAGEVFFAAVLGQSAHDAHDGISDMITYVGRRFVARWTPEGRHEPWMEAYLPGEDPGSDRDAVPPPLGSLGIDGLPFPESSGSEIRDICEAPFEVSG